MKVFLATWMSEWNTLSNVGAPTRLVSYYHLTGLKDVSVSECVETGIGPVSKKSREGCGDGAPPTD